MIVLHFIGHVHVVHVAVQYLHLSNARNLDITTEAPIQLYMYMYTRRVSVSISILKYTGILAIVQYTEMYWNFDHSHITELCSRNTNSYIHIGFTHIYIHVHVPVD